MATKAKKATSVSEIYVQASPELQAFINKSFESAVDEMFARVAAMATNGFQSRNETTRSATIGDIRKMLDAKPYHFNTPADILIDAFGKQEPKDAGSSIINFAIKDITFQA